jgi:AraC-like DNA-binding protein
MNKNGQVIETLSNSKIFEDYGRAYTETTGLPIAIRPMETWQLPLHGKRKENPWCALMAGQSRTCAACLQMQDKLAKAATAEPCTLACEYGLSETAVPIKLGSETIGYLQTGQVLRQKPTESCFQRALERAEELGVKVDMEEARKTYFNTPILPQKKMEAVASLLSIFANHLSIESNQIVMQTANAEPPVITKAKQFMEENYTEDFSLGDVAKSVHTSTFYFCKLFKKATGINFTDYVARLRTEKAKNLLLNPNLRVSEIAYEVGFQSLTHFNRVFKKLLGESPTAYRAKLPTA